VSGGIWSVQGSPIPPFLAQWHNASVTPYPYDPDRALALFEEAGWTKGSNGLLQKDGQPFKFTLSWGRIEGREEIGTFLQQYWQALGLDVTAEGVEWSAMLARFAARDYEAFLDRWVAPLTPDMYNYFHSSAAQGGKNSAVYSNPEVDRLLEEGRTTLDPEASKQIYLEFQELIHEEQPQVFLLWHPDSQVRRQGYTGIPEMAMSNGDMLTYAHEFAKVE
jgi:peptide/nickel transport system substrate-binding protein